MGVLAEVARSADPGLAFYAVSDPGPGRFAATSRDRDAEFVLEAVYEGYLAHYGRPRAFGGMDEDLDLLAGDALYALGLQRLAAAGDLTAVAQLAELIAGCACAEADQRTADAERLWTAGVAQLTL